MRGPRRKRFPAHDTKSDSGGEFKGFIRCGVFRAKPGRKTASFISAPIYAEEHWRGWFGSRPIVAPDCVHPRRGSELVQRTRDHAWSGLGNVRKSENSMMNGWRLDRVCQRTRPKERTCLVPNINQHVQLVTTLLLYYVRWSSSFMALEAFPVSRALQFIEKVLNVEKLLLSCAGCRMWLDVVNGTTIRRISPISRWTRSSIQLGQTQSPLQDGLGLVQNQTGPCPFFQLYSSVACENTLIGFTKYNWDK